MPLEGPRKSGSPVASYPCTPYPCWIEVLFAGRPGNSGRVEGQWSTEGKRKKHFRVIIPPVLIIQVQLPGIDAETKLYGTQVVSRGSADRRRTTTNL